MEPEDLASAPHRVEAYLDQILAPLSRRLSSFHRDELRRELRAHLWERITSYRELELTEDEAVTEALRQFGGAEDFLLQWQRGWAKTTQRVTLREVWEAARPAWRPSLAGIACAFLPVVAIGTTIHQWDLYLHSPVNLFSSPSGMRLHNFGNTSFVIWVWFGYLLMPIVVGIRQGRHRPNRAGIGMLAALTAEFLITSLLYEIAAWYLPYSIWDWPLGLGPGVRGYSDFLLKMIAAWIPLATGAASISGWWERRSESRRLA